MTACRIWVLLYANITNCITVSEQVLFKTNIVLKQQPGKTGIQNIYESKFLTLVHIYIHKCRRVLA